MSLLSLVRVSSGQVGILPGTVKMITTADLSTITTANYLQNTANSPAKVIGLSPNDVVECLYSYNVATGTGTLAYFQPNLASGIFTLNIWENPGNILLPVVAGDFAVFNGTAGQIKDLGYLPTNAAKTKVVMLNSSPAVVGDVATFSAVDGTIQDSGTLLSSLQAKANIKAAKTANIGGAGAGPITVTVAGLTSASVVVATIATSSNTVVVAKTVAGSGNFDVLFSADPGATCTLNYVAFVAAQ